MTDKPPSIVLALAAHVKMTPLSWKEHTDRVVICFAEGPKLTFQRADARPPKPAGRTVTPVRPLPAKKPRSKKTLMQPETHT